jgi:hypothetical protein
MDLIQVQGRMKQYHGGKSSKNNYINLFIRDDGQSVKIYSDATIVFPIVVAETFVKNKNRASKK